MPVGDLPADDGSRGVDPFGELLEPVEVADSYVGLDLDVLHPFGMVARTQGSAGRHLGRRSDITPGVGPSFELGVTIAKLRLKERRQLA
jgi:hypothetical protein